MLSEINDNECSARVGDYNGSAPGVRADEILGCALKNDARGCAARERYQSWQRRREAAVAVSFRRRMPGNAFALHVGSACKAINVQTTGWVDAKHP